MPKSLMPKSLVKRTAATGAAFLAIGCAGAISLPTAASAATTRPVSSQNPSAQQAKCHIVKEPNPDWVPGDPPWARYIYYFYCGLPI
jgi:hypothetical protein